MTVQPSAFSAAVAGTQRAVTRSGDAEASNVQAANRQVRAENPSGQSGGVEEVERDAAMGDSGADGRQLLGGRDQQSEPEDGHEGSDDAAHQRVSKAGAGGHVDFDA